MLSMERRAKEGLKMKKPPGTIRIHPNSLLTNNIAGGPVKNDEMQDGRILRNKAYNPYAAMTEEEAQHRGSRFSTAC